MFVVRGKSYTQQILSSWTKDEKSIIAAVARGFGQLCKATAPDPIRRHVREALQDGYRTA